ncbi:hypothetical protein [Leptothermofonsia sp. ETS-13]|uniref:hypothetical protein n=1 Tax=Leptothermofonsia sp. ETS-13 TaxID=3035696 RepID=UPI003B9E597D
MLEDTASGNFDNKFYQMAVVEDVIRVDIPPNSKDTVREDTIKKIEETRAQIASGTLKVPFVLK